ncbi:MAG TPA: cyclase family protein [Acidobacteriota bacterium]|nr:cyclase family protein [Acidobacteriota bacterium]
MKWIRRLGLCFFALVLALVTVANAQQADWYPSEWGSDDRRGAANRVTPAKVLAAAELITQGEVYELGRAYENGMPLYGNRHYSLRIPVMSGPVGDNDVTWHMSVVSSQIGQVGTQFDGLGHIGIGDLYYNGLSRHDIVTPEGLTSLGVEEVGPIVTRGVLIDVAAYKGVAILDGDYEIMAADLQGALDRQGVRISTGDVVLIHTGWGSLWMEDNARFNARAPGIGVDAAQFLVDEEIVMVGSDTWGTEVIPNPDPSLVFPVHQLLIAKNGIYNMENLATEVLVDDQTYEFVFVYAPLPLKGAPGSPGNPVAIR